MAQMTRALVEGEWSAASPGSTLHPGKTQYPLYRRQGGPQGRTGRAKNLANRDSIPGPSSHIQSLYRLSYPAHTSGNIYIYIYIYIYIQKMLRRDNPVHFLSN